MKLTLFVMSLFLGASAHADELRTSTARAHADETFQVVITLTGSYAELDAIDVPTRGASIEGSPSIESSFSWINGVTQRQKIFRYTLRPEAIGTATIGPVTVRDSKGQTQTLAAASVEIVPDVVGTSLDPAALLRSYAAAGRERIAVVPEVSVSSARVGQQVVITWYLYTAEAIDDVSLATQAVMTDFWVEEIPLTRREEGEFFIDGEVVKKVAVRRAAIFPLRSGTLSIEPISIVADVLRGSDDIPRGFAIFNANEVQVRRRSARITLPVVDQRPATVAVGEHFLRCTRVRSTPDGPVSFDVHLRGSGNLRSVASPRFLGAVDGEIQVIDGGVNVDRAPAGVTMERKWTLLVFPKRSGQLLLPSLGVDVFDLRQQRPLTLQCSFGPVNVERVTQASGDEASSRPSARSLIRDRRFLPLLLAVGGGLVVAGLAARAMRKRRVRRRLEEKADSVLRAVGVRELRGNIDALFCEHGTAMRSVMHENSERGELARAVSSLIDFREKNPATARELTEELRAQVMQLIEVLESAGKRESNRKSEGKGVGPDR